MATLPAVVCMATLNAVDSMWPGIYRNVPGIQEDVGDGVKACDSRVGVVTACGISLSDGRVRM